MSGYTRCDDAGESDRLRPVLVALLSVIADNPGIRPSELGDLLGIQRTHMGPLVRELVDAGLVRRYRSAQDGRALELRLTALGGVRTERERAAMSEYERGMAECLSDEEIVQLRDVLRRIILTNSTS